MPGPFWDNQAYPETGTTVLEAVLGPTLNAVAIRSDDRISAQAIAIHQHIFVVSLAPKPPREWQWTSVRAGEVELIREPSGQVHCDLLPTGRADVRQPVGDSQAALALGLDRRTWVSVRAIVEVGMAAAAAMTATAANRAVEHSLRVNPQVVARRLTELIAHVDARPAAASPRTSHAAGWESVSHPPVSSPRRSLPTAQPDRPLGPSL